MKLIDRHILNEYLIPLFYCVAGFCLLYIVLDLFDRFPDFVEAKTPLPTALLFYLYYLFAVNGFVPFLVVVMPVALLLAALFTLLELARHNELTAMRASGVSLRRLMVPLVAVGGVAAIASFVAQETIGPHATKWVVEYRRAISRSGGPTRGVIEGYVFHSPATHRHWVIDEFDPENPERLAGVKITQDRPDGSLEREMQADWAQWLDGTWWLVGFRVREYDAQGEPLGGMSPPGERPVERLELTETPRDLLDELQEMDFLSSWDMYRYLKNRPNLSRQNRARRMVDLQARLAMPWSCFVMVLLSLPAAATTRRWGALASVLFALTLLFGFYFLVQLGMVLGKRELLWPWLAAWMPNMLFAIVGGSLLVRLR